MKKLAPILALVVVAVVAYYAGMNNKPADGVTHDTSGRDPRIVMAETSLVGKWSAEDDRNFEREIKGDGTVTDSYGSPDGEVKSYSKWELFTSDNPPAGVEFQLNNKDVYVKQTDGRTDSVTFYRVMSVTPTELELVNMTKGGGTRFGKITTNAMTDGQEDIIQKYKCADGQVITANLSNEEEISVWAEGTEPGFFKRSESANGRKYVRGEWEYFFRGKEMTLTNTKTQTSTKCAPVTEEGMAPVNVGD
jgi:membrane-bound inhibitor of C-type lysozyme